MAPFRCGNLLPASLHAFAHCWKRVWRFLTRSRVLLAATLALCHLLCPKWRRPYPSYGPPSSGLPSIGPTGVKLLPPTSNPCCPWPPPHRWPRWLRWVRCHSGLRLGRRWMWWSKPDSSGLKAVDSHQHQLHHLYHLSARDRCCLVACNWGSPWVALAIRNGNFKERSQR